MKDKTAKEILDEITTFCGNECSSAMCCPEDDCILYRIEQIALNEYEWHEDEEY